MSVLLLLTPWLARAQCGVSDYELYGLFKQYRERINTATRLDDLSPYFSSVFNEYYVAKLPLLSNDPRYLTHYWDNLNTAKDIVIVYDYAAQCASPDNAGLNLLVILNEPLASRLDLWDVAVHYVREEGRWLINSFEYRKSRSGRNFKENEIIDNFAVVR